MTPNPSESDLAAAVQRLRTLKREDIVLRGDIAARDTVLAALASAQRDGKRLEEALCSMMQTATIHGASNEEIAIGAAAMSKEPPL